MSPPLCFLLVILAAFSPTEGSHDEDVTCFSCSGASSPLLCQTTEACGLDEVCYTREYFDHNQRRVFRMGCENKQVCSLLAQGNHLVGRQGQNPAGEGGDNSLCFSCCDVDHCNMEMCLEAAGVNKTDTSLPGGHTCLPGFVKGPNSCLYFATWKESWDDAKKGCEEFGAHLVKIEDQTEDLFIVSQIKQLRPTADLDGYWTGGHLDKTTNQWLWLDGSHVTYTRWGPGEPDHHEEYIALVNPTKWYSNWDWADHGVKGYVACGYICERPFSARAAPVPTQF